VQNIGEKTTERQVEVETDRAEKAAQAKHDGPEATMTRLFGLLTADGRAEILAFARDLVPVHGDFIPPSIPELIRQGAPMSARRLTLADVVDCCLAMSPAHLNELADTAGALVRSEGKRPPLWEPGDDQGDLLDDEGDVTILANLRHRIGEAIQRTELQWTTGWQAKAAEAMRTAYDSLLAVEDEAMNGKTAEDGGAEPSERTFTPAIVRAMEKLSVDGKVGILHDIMAEQQGLCQPETTEDMLERFSDHLKGIGAPKREAVLLKTLTDIIEAGPPEAKAAVA